MTKLFRDCFQHLNSVERHRISIPTSEITLRLNRGERPEPVPISVQAMVANRLVECLPALQQSPTYPEFYNTLSVFAGFPPEQICIGLGIEDLIRTLYILCCDPGQPVAAMWPSCAMFEVYAESFALQHVKITPKPGEDFPMSRVIASVPSNTRLVLLPN